MLVLIAADVVQGVAVGSVRERRAFVLDRGVKHIERCLVNVPPLSDRKFVATRRRMHAGNIEDFRSIQIADTGNCLLVE